MIVLQNAQLLELTPENFQDLLQIRNLLKDPKVHLEYVHNWRDKYHGHEDRVIIKERVSVTDTTWNGPCRLIISARTPHGERRKISLPLGALLRIFHPEPQKINIFPNKMTETFYYIGIDENTLVHGVVSRGRLSIKGSRYFSLKETTPEIVTEWVRKFASAPYIHHNGWDVKIVHTPGITLSGLTGSIHVLEGYAENNWQKVSCSWHHLDAIWGQILFQRRKNRTVPLPDVHQVALIRKVFVEEDIPPDVFEGIISRLGEDHVHKLEVLPSEMEFHRIIPPEGLAIKYFD